MGAQLVHLAVPQVGDALEDFENAVDLSIFPLRLKLLHEVLRLAAHEGAVVEEARVYVDQIC